MKKTLLILVLFFVASKSNAVTINVPGNYVTIQSGLNAANAGDVVLVQPGTYKENIVWPLINGITLSSAGDSSNTIINGNLSGRVLSFTSSSIDTLTKVIGFKIMNGQSAVFPTGAGIYLNDASPLFLNCAIRNNIGNGDRCYGAGIAMDNSKAVFRNCVIEKNSGKKTFGSSYNHGGGIYADNASVLVMENCIVRQNLLDVSTYSYGSGIYVYGSVIKLTNVQITANQSHSSLYNYGAGIYLGWFSNATLNRVYVTGNQILDGNYLYGAGIYSSFSTLNATNVLIANNTMGAGGGYYEGGGIMLDNKNSCKLMNVTVANNNRTDGGSITGGSLNSYNDSVYITNSILWSPTNSAEISILISFVSVDHSDIYGGYGGNGNINSNPLFVSATDYHIQLASPCAGAGTSSGAPDYDIEGFARPNPANSSPDIGAYETATPTGISEPEDKRINVFPNPSNGNFYVSFYSEAKVVDVLIYNLFGQEVYREHLSGSLLKEKNIDINVEAGLYLMQVTEGDKKFTKKLLLQ